MMNFFDLAGKHNMTVTYVRLALDEPVAVSEPYDTVEDHYFVRDIDALPGIFHADELFEGIRDARGPRAPGGSRRRRMRHEVEGR